MAREDWDYIPVKVETKAKLEKLRAALVLKRDGERVTFDDTVQFLLQHIPQDLQALIGDPQ
ncbi:hypothetical protein [Thermococcus barophilus]|uniref:Uncharacterized protein n=1 Tax=Thermococcus barophilus TaxID=55802 RepID=A0A0S1XET2_THEBA|nr:hypothetical protein [Thermococcus barophilus]ALM76227.1 hypothetical protein TBCH5v1_2332 [Thermococcus barophilus]